VSAWHRLTVWSSFAFVPAVILLTAWASPFALLQLASLVVCVAYHASWETRWVRLDHALAYGVVACNAWMAWHATDKCLVLLALFFVVLGLWRYVLARTVEDAYEVEHSLWHLCCGAANVCFAVAYVAR